MAQRLNTRFLIILTLIVVAFAALAVAAKLLWHREPMNYAALGNAAAQSGKWDEAIADYQRALSLGRGDPDTYVRLGEALEHRVGENPALLKQAQTAYENALVVDPGNLAASRHLFELFVGLLDVEPGPTNYAKLGDVSARLARLDPADRRAVAYQKVAAILLADASTSSGARGVKSDFDDLAAMVRKDPSDANLPYFFGQAKLRLAAAAAKENDVDTATRLAHDAASLFDDALGLRPNDAILNWRASQVYTKCSRIDAQSSAAYLQKASAALTEAELTAKPTDPHYADIQVAAALAAVAHQQPDQAEKILRDLLAAKPDSATAQLQLAGFLNRIRHQRDDAMTLLSKPVVQSDSIGPQALLARTYEQDRLYELARLDAQAYEASKDPATRAKFLSQLQDNYKTLVTMVGERDSASLLYLKALKTQIEGDPVAAMGIYQKALAVMEHSETQDPDLIYRAAMLSAQEGQAGEAEKLYLRVVALDPTFVSPQLALAEIYLQQNAPEKAQPFIDSAGKLHPELAAVTQLRIRQLLEQNQKDAAQAQYATLPEISRDDQFAKAQSALLVGDAADAQRLLEPLQKLSPDDSMIANLLARAYVANQHLDLAQAMVEQGLAKNPKSIWLLVLRQKLQIVAGAPASAAAADILAATNDFTREVYQGENEFRHGNYQGAAEHLAAADKLKPQDVRVHELDFQLDLAEHRLDLAGQEVGMLAKMNADSAGGLIYQIRLLLAQGDYANAVRKARDLVKSRAEFAQAYAILGTALLADGQPDKAVAEFNNALDRQPANLDALLGLIDAYTSLNQPDQIAGVIASARKLLPANDAIRDKAIEYDLAFSDHPEAAVDERQRLLDAHPDEPTAYVDLARAALRTSQREQDTHPDVAAKAMQQASDALNKAVVRWPHDTSIVGLLSQVRHYQGDAAGAEKLLLDLAAVPELASSPAPSLQLFEFYQKTGRPDAAISALQTAFEKSNHAVAVEVRLAQALMSARRFDDALKILQDANAGDPAIQRQRLEVLVAAGRVDEALSQLKSALNTSPTSIDLLNLLTATYIGAGRYADARPAAKNAIAVDPNNNDALYHQAVVELHVANGDVDLAMRDAVQLKLQNPANALAYGLLSDVYYRLKQPADAVRALEDGLKAVPEDRNARLRLLSAYAATTPPDWTHYDEVVGAAERDPHLRNDPVWLIDDARGLTARRQFDQAIQKVDQAIALAPNDSTLISEKMSILMDAGNYPAVVDVTDKLLAANSKQWWVYLARGSAECQTDKVQGEKDLDTALTSAPDAETSARVIGRIAAILGVPKALALAQPRDGEPQWRLMTGDLMVENHDFAGAVSELTPVREDTSLNPSQKIHVLTVLAESYTILHQAENARDAYLEAIAIDPNDPILLNNLADLLADDLKEPQQALKYSQKAYDLQRSIGEDVPGINDTQGWVLTLCGGLNASAGLEILRKVVEEHQDFLDARYHLGEAYLRSAMPGDAVKQLEMAQMQVQQIEGQHGSVAPELKSAIAASLARARQMLDGKADAGGN